MYKITEQEKEQYLSHVEEMASRFISLEWGGTLYKTLWHYASLNHVITIGEEGTVANMERILRHIMDVATTEDQD